MGAGVVGPASRLATVGVTAFDWTRRGFDIQGPSRAGKLPMGVSSYRPRRRAQVQKYFTFSCFALE